MGIVFGFLAYLGVGLVFLVILDLLTGRVHKRISDKANESQMLLAEQYIPVTPKMATIWFVVALLLFWPAVIVGIWGEGIYNKGVARMTKARGKWLEKRAEALAKKEDTDGTPR